MWSRYMSLRRLIIRTVGKPIKFQQQWRMSFPSMCHTFGAKDEQMYLRPPFISTVGKYINFKHQWWPTFPSACLILVTKSSGCISARSLYLPLERQLNSSSNDGRVFLRSISFWRQSQVDISPPAPFCVSDFGAKVERVSLRRCLSAHYSYLPSERQLNSSTNDGRVFLRSISFWRQSQADISPPAHFCVSDFGAKVERVSLRSLHIPTVKTGIKFQHQWLASFPSKYLILAPMSNGYLSTRSLLRVWSWCQSRAGVSPLARYTYRRKGN